MKKRLIKVGRFFLHQSREVKSLSILHKKTFAQILKEFHRLWDLYEEDKKNKTGVFKYIKECIYKLKRYWDIVKDTHLVPWYYSEEGKLF